MPQPVGPLRTFHLQVHGIFHDNADGTSRQEILRRCNEGEELQFIEEPDNPADPNAIKICRLNGEQLGYCPAEHAAYLTEQLDLGWTFRVSLGEIYHFEDKPKKLGCRLNVDVLSMAHGQRPPATQGAPIPSVDPARNDLRNGFIAVLVVVGAFIFIAAVMNAFSSKLSPAAAPEAAEPIRDAGCGVSDISVDKLHAHTEDTGFTRITGRLTNSCASAIGAQLKVTVYDKADEILNVDDIWPASINNIPARSEFPFEWVERVDGISRFTVSVIAVKSWQSH
jgi:HIRAN domain